MACLALNLETKLATLFVYRTGPSIMIETFSRTGLISYPPVIEVLSLFPLDQLSDEAFLIFRSASQLALVG